MRKIIYLTAFALILQFSSFNAWSLPSNWNYSITFNSHVILVQQNVSITIDNVPIDSGDFLGLFYINSSGIQYCAGYLEYQGATNSINGWPEDLGDDGFESGDAIIWKIWDSSENTEYIAEPVYNTSGSFPNSGYFQQNGLSGLVSLSAYSNVLPWNYNITGGNHTILIPDVATLTINNIQISQGDYLGVFYNAGGILACGGYVEWLGYTNSISAWGADIGNDGFANGEEFIWKIWNKSDNSQTIAKAYYMGAPMPNQGLFVVNGMSGLDSLTQYTAPWNYNITGTNHTILIPDDGTYLINNIPISIGDYIGVFYDSLGSLACGGYTIWQGFNTSIAAWGEDLGADGFVAGENFKWKIWDISEGTEYFASAIYMGTPLPNQGNFVINGMSGVDTLMAINNPPSWNYSITGNNHTILIPNFGIYTTPNGPIEMGDFIGVFYDSLGTYVCGGYIQWYGQLTTLAAWGEDTGNDGFQQGENFHWKIWNTSSGTEFDVVATYMEPPAMPNSGQFASNGMSGILALEIYQPAPDWTFTNTGANHSILIPDNISILINGNQIEPGDYLGVFYDSLGIPACAGYIEYTGITIALTAWGEDIGNDGFALGEEFNWMVWDASEDTSYIIYGQYDPIFPNQEFYSLNGISSLLSLTTEVPFETQEIILTQGWGIYSTYIIPQFPNLDSLFSNIIQYTIMVKDADGHIFWPDYNVNLIGNIIIGEGYLIKMTSLQTLSITGSVVIPETTGIVLNTGWDMIAYLRKTPAAIATIMNPIINSIILVKDGDGNIFWPQYFLNLIGNMHPGKGYQIKLNSPEVLYYPANSVNTAKNLVDIRIPTAHVVNTGNNMTICIPSDAWPNNYYPVFQDEIIICDQSGQLFGKGLCTGENVAITIWGNDELTNIKDGLFTNEQFSIFMRNGDKIIVEKWSTGSDTYESNKISIADKVTIEKGHVDPSLLEIYPNPMVTQSVIKYTLPDDGNAEANIYNILGNKILSIQLTNQKKGINYFKIKKNSFSSGSYILEINYNGLRKSTILSIL